MTTMGARRRAASDRTARAWTASMAQASPLGCAGHQEAPASVAPVSSSAKPTARSTSIASQCRPNHVRRLMPITLCHLAPGPGAGETFGGARNHTKVAGRRAGPFFRRAGPYRRPCRAAGPLACNGYMQTEPELAAATDACVNNEQESFLPGVLEVAGLRKSYGSVQAVRDVSFTVRPGEIVALLGPNGAGKTTTLEILEGFRRRDGGTAEVLGLDPGDRSTRSRAARADRAGPAGHRGRAVPDRPRDDQPRSRLLPGTQQRAGGHRAGRPRRAGAAQGPDALRRAEAPPGPGPGPDRPSGAAVPGRADDRVRPGRPPGRLAAGARAAHGGHHDPADHPCHG